MIDLEFQKVLLKELAGIYPQPISNMNLAFEGHDKEKVHVNLIYLFHHGLIYGKPFPENYPDEVEIPRITAKGLDYLRDDGGLTAELGVVTIKLHEDTIKQLLIIAIETSPAESTVKSQLISQIKAAPADLLKGLVTEGLKVGLSHLPNAALWLRTQLGG